MLLNFFIGFCWNLTYFQKQYPKWYILTSFLIFFVDFSVIIYMYRWFVELLFQFMWTFHVEWKYFIEWSTSTYMGPSIAIQSHRTSRHLSHLQYSWTQHWSLDYLYHTQRTELFKQDLYQFFKTCGTFQKCSKLRSQCFCVLDTTFTILVVIIVILLFDSLFFL